MQRAGYQDSDIPKRTTSDSDVLGHKTGNLRVQMRTSLWYGAWKNEGTNRCFATAVIDGIPTPGECRPSLDPGDATERPLDRPWEPQGSGWGRQTDTGPFRTHG